MKLARKSGWRWKSDSSFFCSHECFSWFVCVCIYLESPLPRLAMQLRRLNDLLTSPQVDSTSSESGQAGSQLMDRQNLLTFVTFSVVPAWICFSSWPGAPAS